MGFIEKINWIHWTIQLFMVRLCLKVPYLESLSLFLFDIVLQQWLFLPTDHITWTTTHKETFVWNTIAIRQFGCGESSSSLVFIGSFICKTPKNPFWSISTIIICTYEIIKDFSYLLTIFIFLWGLLVLNNIRLWQYT